MEGKKNTEPVTEIDFPRPHIASSPSQRLRYVLYRRWEQLNSTEPFDTWYERMLTGITERVKKSLVDRDTGERNRRW